MNLKTHNLFQSSQTKRTKSSNVQKIEDLAKMTENRLLRIESVFPFDFFPDKLYIEQKQIVVVYKQFFFNTQEYSILIEDVLSPIVENGVFFSTLRLQLGPGGFQQDPPELRFLWKKDAQIVRQMIVGLLICQKEKIDLSHLAREELIQKILQIGMVKRGTA